MPYRETQPLATYELRSNRTIFVLLGVFALGTLGSVVLLATAASARGLYLLAASGWALATFAYATSVKSHVVAGGYGHLRLFRHHLEVPHAWSRSVLHLPYEELSVGVRHIAGRVAWKTVGRVDVLVLESDGVVRELSSRLFRSRALLQEAMEDIRALQRGRPLPHRTPDGVAPRPTEERDQWDERLEAELDRID